MVPWNSRSDPGRLVHVVVRIREPRVNRSQSFDVGSIRPLCGDPRHVDLDRAANLVDVLEVHVAASEKQAERFGHGGAFDGRYTQAATGSRFDNALGDQCPNRLPNHCSGDAEMLAELALGRKGVARSHALGDDRLENRLGNRVRESRRAGDLPETLRCETGRGAFSDSAVTQLALNR